MTSSEDTGASRMDSITTGISLDGLVSGTPSVLNAEWYKTGFGMKYAKRNRLNRLAAYYNAMYRVAFSGSSYEPRSSIFTEIEQGQEGQLGKIYASSNWVVFVDPKVDLSFFQKKTAQDDELMIIHYSDQYTSASGYDDITVTQKSEQYNEIIYDQLQKKGVTAGPEDIKNIISLFNAINGGSLLLVKKYLEKLQIQAQREHESKIMAAAVEKVNSVFSDYLTSQNDDMTQVRGFINYLEEKAEQDNIEIVFDISDMSLYQLNTLLGTGFLKVKGQALQAMADCWNGQAKVDEIDSYLSVDIDEKALTKLYKKIKTIEQEIVDLEISIENERKKRTVLHGDVIRATSEYNRFVEQFLSELELNDDSDRIMKYSHYVTRILDEYKVRLQERKIGILAQTMTSCYKKLANKKNLIDQIRMDAVTLDFEYLSADGNVVPKESLSAGEKQLMVISLLWALAICSKKKLPVIIDTPLSRMDSNHRISLITTYFPQASDQTIILSTDSEIDGRYYDIMKENVGDEFTLVYNDDMKCSTIQKGYFVGELHDN